MDKLVLLVFLACVLLPQYSSTQGICGTNEQFYNSSLSPTCHTNCQDLTRVCRLTTTGAVAGCYCREGFARNLQLQCMPISHCDEDCFRNEKPIAPAERACENVCPSRRHSSLRRLCYNRRERKCVCEPKYCRDGQAQCVKMNTN